MKLKIIVNITIVLLSIYILPAYAEKRIAVLPLEVLSDRKDMKQFGIGTMDTLTNALSNVPDFIMIDRGQLNAVMKEIAFQNSNFVDPEKAIKIGKLLGAEVLVIGTIQSEDNRYRINIHFTDVQSGKILKTSQVTGTSIFDLQDQLSSEIINQQNVKITQAQQQRITTITKATANITAYDSYIRGRTGYFLFTQKGLNEAIFHFDQALKTDPGFNLALSAKSEAQSLLAFQLRQNEEPFEELMKQAEINAMQALLKDPNSAETHRALSIIYASKSNFKESASEAKKAIELNPNDAEAYFLLWKSNMDDLSNVQKALGLNPYLGIAHSELGTYYLRQNKLELAESEFKKSLQISPDSDLTHNNMGLVFQDQKKENLAISEYKKAIEINPNTSLAHTNLGALYINQNKFDEGMAELNIAIKISPNSSNTNIKIILAYIKQKKFTEALILSQRILDSSPKETKLILGVYTLRGIIYLNQNKPEDAITEFKKTFDFMKNKPEMKEFNFELANNHYLLGNIYFDQHKTDDAVLEFKEAVKLNPNHPESHYYLGVIYFTKKNYTDAINEFKSALHLKPDYPLALLFLAEAYFNARNFEEAISTYKYIIELAPKFDEPHVFLGDIYKQQRKIDEAIAEYKEALKIKPDNNETKLKFSDFYYEIGASFHLKGKLNEAMSNYKSSLELNPNNANTHNNLGAVYFSQNKSEDAINEYKKAIKALPEYANAYENIGIVYEREKKNAEAVIWFKKACSLGSSSSCQWLNERKIKY